MVAMDYPPNLGEGKHLLTPENELQLLLGQALAADGRAEEARTWLERAALPKAMSRRARGRRAVLAALALRQLGGLVLRPKPDSSRWPPARVPGPCRRAHPHISRHRCRRSCSSMTITLRARQEARYLEGLALLGLDRRRAARSRFGALLAERPDHLEAPSDSPISSAADDQTSSGRTLQPVKPSGRTVAVP